MSKKPLTNFKQISNVDLIRACDLKPVKIPWFWEGWIASGKLHILGGAPGSGKTTIAMTLASVISNGGSWPDGSTSKVGNVVIWSGEDDYNDTLLPRLIQAGANIDRIYFIAGINKGEKRIAFDPANDMEELRLKLLEIGEVQLLIIDPIVSAITGDSHKNAEVRRSLQPLTDLAASMNCAVLGITHFSKGTSGRDPVERLTGSLAFGAVARIVLVVAKQQEHGEGGRIKRIFLRAKSNIGPDDGGFEYEFLQGELIDHPGISTSSIKWLKPIKGSAQELLTKAEKICTNIRQGSKEDAMCFLSELLSDGPLPASSIQEQCVKAGYSIATINRAKTALEINVVKEGGSFGSNGQQWIWQLSTESVVSDDTVIKC